MSMKILVVEDGLISEQMAKFALQSLDNIDVDCIESGEEVLALLHTRDYQIIFMDIGACQAWMALKPPNKFAKKKPT